jgi:hypothetical protein
MVVAVTEPTANAARQTIINRAKKCLDLPTPILDTIFKTSLSFTFEIFLLSLFHSILIGRGQTTST